MSTVKLENKIFIIEFKVVDKNSAKDDTQEAEKKNRALQQIKDKRYYEKYLSVPNQAEIYLVGLEFNAQDRNIDRFDWEKIIAKVTSKNEEM